MLVSRWLDDNLMKANVSKTKVKILVTSARTCKVNDVNIVMSNSTVNSYKYLGVTIDASLKWKDHINTVTRKMCNSLHILR